MKFLCIIACALSGAYASPYRYSKRDLAQNILNDMILFSQYSAAAYCRINNNSTNTKVACPQTNNCPRVESASTNTTWEFEKKGFFDTTGFVATDHTNQKIVVSFRGARSVTNFLTIVPFALLVDIDICSGCQVMLGFWEAWKPVLTDIHTAVSRARTTNPTYKVVATGHSLGGALANIAAGTLRKNGTKVDLYTYGAQRTGNEAFARYISSTTNGTNFRVTHANDPSHCLLPSSLNGFAQISPEYYITSGNSGVPTVNDVSVLEGTDMHCAQVAGDLNFLITSTGSFVDAHSYYFGLIDSCQ